MIPGCCSYIDLFLSVTYTTTASDQYFVLERRGRNFMRWLGQEAWLQCLENTTIVIIFAWKGAIQDFYNLLTAPQTVSKVYALMARAQSYANHVQHIKCLPRAACHVPRGTK